MSAVDVQSTERARASRPADGSHPQHLVQFYESDDFLAKTVADFLGEGLAAGARVVVIATAAHRKAFVGCLEAAGHEVTRVEASGQLRLLDAAELLSQFMVDSMPDAELFRAALDSAIGPVADGKLAAPMRAYGEMVDLLWREGNSKAALRLEELWNDLQVAHSFSLLCAYVMASFYKEAADFQLVCATHTHVLRSEHGASGLDGTGARTTEMSPQHARALADEIAQRKQVEHALRESLREQRKKEDELRRNVLRSERLGKVTAAIAVAVTPDEVMQAVVDQVAFAVEASSAGLWLLQDVGQPPRLMRHVGYAEAAIPKLEEMAAKQVAYPALDCARTGQPLWIDSQEALLEAYPHLSSVTTPGRSYQVACLPIVAQGRAIGSLNFSFDCGPLMDADHRSFLMLVARYTGQALERVRLLHAERDSAERAELLYGLAAAVIGADRVEDVFDVALNGLERALGASRSSILTYDADGVMRFKASRGLSDAYRQAVEGHSPWTRDVRVVPEPIFIEDALRDPNMSAYAPLFEREGVGALGFVPLFAGGQLLGKFMVYYDAVRTFSAQDKAMAKAIANHVASAINRFTTMAALQETLRYNELFAGVLAHDLRNPLGAILMSAQVVLCRQEGEGDKDSKPLGRILSSGERMMRMVDQLLDFTRARVGGGFELRPRHADLMEICRQVIDELEVVHPNWKIDLECVGDMSGRWDVDRLAQVISNLLANAGQHGTPEDGVRVRIDGNRPTGLTLDIHNRGAIPGALLPTLFDPFRRSHRSRHARGLGLGLFITKQLIEGHGGRVDVASSEADGTTFTIRLPRNAAAKASL